MVRNEGKVDPANIMEDLSFKRETYLCERALDFVQMWNFPEQMIH
jgi:hypothetical protein